MLITFVLLHLYLQQVCSIDCLSEIKFQWQEMWNIQRRLQLQCSNFSIFHFSIIIAANIDLIIGLFDEIFVLVLRLVQNKWSSKTNNHLFDMIGRKGNILAPFTIPATTPLPTPSAPHTFKMALCKNSIAIEMSVLSEINLHFRNSTYIES